MNLKPSIASLAAMVTLASGCMDSPYQPPVPEGTRDIIDYTNSEVCVTLNDAAMGLNDCVGYSLPAYLNCELEDYRQRFGHESQEACEELVELNFRECGNTYEEMVNNQIDPTCGSRIHVQLIEYGHTEFPHPDGDIVQLPGIDRLPTGFYFYIAPGNFGDYDADGDGSNVAMEIAGHGSPYGLAATTNPCTYGVGPVTVRGDICWPHLDRQ